MDDRSMGASPTASHKEAPSLEAPTPGVGDILRPLSYPNTDWSGARPSDPSESNYRPPHATGSPRKTRRAGGRINFNPEREEVRPHSHQAPATGKGRGSDIHKISPAQTQPRLTGSLACYCPGIHLFCV